MNPETVLAAVPKREATGDALVLTPALRHLAAQNTADDGTIDTAAILAALPAGKKFKQIYF